MIIKTRRKHIMDPIQSSTVRLHPQGMLYLMNTYLAFRIYKIHTYNKV